MRWILLSLAICLFLSGCEANDDSKQGVKPAGQPLDPVSTAARIARVRGAALVGDQDEVRRQMDALNDDVRRSMKLPDAARRIDPESARQAAKQVEGVRSVAWIDRDNLLAIVSRNELRSYDTIDAICRELDPLGDTLAVVVNVQSGVARTGDELEVLSRNCQLPPGDRALFQRNRQVDVVSPQIREQHKRNNAAPVVDPARLKREQDEAMRLLEASTPEM